MKKLDIVPVEWRGDHLRILDQTKLPHQEVYLEFTDFRDVAAAIRELKVRGAPAIGVAAAYGVALGALSIKAKSAEEFRRKLRPVIDAIAATRPTARNLFRAIERMEQAATGGNTPDQIKQALVAEAIKIHEDEKEATLKISQLGAELVPDNSVILTHCNAGPLATCGYGTALGVIMYAKEQGKNIRVVATETRPLLQGARLTTWELHRAKVPVTLITDSMAGYVVSRGGINLVIVGADRIAANGDTANKIGTSVLAILAHEHGIPFYVAAPTSTIDRSLASGNDIPIEQRAADEVTNIQGVCLAPEGCDVLNPAFDVTPHRYITAIITEKGIMREPYGEGINKMASHL